MSQITHLKTLPPEYLLSLKRIHVSPSPPSFIWKKPITFSLISSICLFKSVKH